MKELYKYEKKDCLCNNDIIANKYNTCMWGNCINKGPDR